MTTTDRIQKMKIPRRSKKRHLRTRLIRKIEGIPFEEFDKVFPRVPESYHFFKTLDESKFEQFYFYYILVYENKELVAAAPCFTLNYSLDTGINGPWGQLCGIIKKFFPNLFDIKALVCGIPLGQGHMGITQGSAGLLEAIEGRMESLARKIHAPLIVFKDFDQSYDNFFKPLLKNGYLKIDGLPMTRLTLDYSNFEDYLTTLSSSTRYDLRKKIKKASVVKVEPSIICLPDEKTLNEVYSLYLQSLEPRHRDLKIIPMDFFRLVSKNMSPKTKFFLFHINGKLAAFALCLVSEGILLECCAGFDYTLAHEYHLYFVKFKGIAIWCLENGIKAYEMGATGYEPKRRLNFNFVPVYLYVKIRNKVLRPLFKCACTLIKFENFDPELKRWRKLQRFFYL